MSYPNVLNLKRDQEGRLFDSTGRGVYCSVDNCDHEALACVAVSCNKAHDSARCYCATCYEAYSTGVQHGRFHEAALRGDTGPWGDNTAQFPRLLAQIEAVGGITEEIMQRLCLAMNLQPSQVMQIIGQAQQEWDRTKAATRAHKGRRTRCRAPASPRL